MILKSSSLVQCLDRSGAQCPPTCSKCLEDSDVWSNTVEWQLVSSSPSSDRRWTILTGFWEILRENQENLQKINIESNG